MAGTINLAGVQFASSLTVLVTTSSVNSHVKLCVSLRVEVEESKNN